MSDVTTLLERLQLYRQTLRYALDQARVHGGVALAPPATRYTIDEARNEIREIKANLSRSGTMVGDEPDDEPTPQAVQAAAATAGSGPFSGQSIGDVAGSVYRADGNIYINSQHAQGGNVSGDQINFNGDFRGAILNVKSTLTDVQQSIGAAPRGDAATKAELDALIAKLSDALQTVPPEHDDDAEAVAESAKQAVEQATKAKPNKTMVTVTAEGLKSAAQNLATVVPIVIPIAQQIAEAVRKLAGG